MLTTAALKRTPAPVRAATAWFIPGDDPSVWLEEAARWDVSTDKLRFFVLTGFAEGTIEGVLAVPPPETSSNLAVSRAQPYGELRLGFFVPVDAILWPPMGEKELAAESYFPVAVFHPTLGLTGFDAQAERRASDFLKMPEKLGENWNRAKTGPTLNEQLRSIRVTAMPSLEELFGAESRDIGTVSPTELAPLPEEPRPKKLDRAREGAVTALAVALAKLTGLVPHRPGIAPNIINHLENWARKKLASAPDNLEDLRQKELERLVRMLETDPYEGLRHAISIAQLSQFGTRGRTPPTSKLGERPLDFNLRRLGGQPAGDSWRVPNEIQNSLAKSYREAAQREAKLGRHRRAACIYAELLGDFASCAAVLKEGRHFREAAVLFRDRLRNVTAAAECFAEAGEIQEAIALYEKNQQWLEIGELATRVGDKAQADRAFRRILELHRQKGDFFNAALVLETKLHEPDEALALLASTWPQGKHALRCLEERFALLGRLNRAEAITALLHELATAAIPSSTVAQLISIVSKVFAHSPDERVRSAAAHTVRVNASVALKNRRLEASDEIAVLRSLTRLAPQDRLLSRDVNRFRQTRPATKRPPRPTTSRPKTLQKLILVQGHCTQLQAEGTWMRVFAQGARFYALARLFDQRLLFARGLWRNSTATLDHHFFSGSPEQTTFVMVPFANTMILSCPFAPSLPPKPLPLPLDYVADFADIGRPSWLPEDVVQASAAGAVLWVVRVVGARVVLGSYSEGKEVYSRDVTAELTAAGAVGGGTSLVLEASAVTGQILLGYGQHLLLLDDRRELKIHDVGSRVLGLLAGPASMPSWIVLLEKGAVQAFPGLKNVSILADDLTSPHGTYMGADRLLLINETEGRVFQLHPDKTFPTAWFEIEAAKSIGITQTENSQEIAVFHSNGKVQRWRVF